MRHLKTDPRCREHRHPRTWWQRRRYDSNRGRECTHCLRWRERRAYYITLGYGEGNAAALASIDLDLW